MTIQLHGNGAGVHALAWKLAESRLCETIYCEPGNAGTQTLCTTDTPAEIVPDADVPQVQLLYAPSDSDINCPEYDDLCLIADNTHAHFFPPVFVRDEGSVSFCRPGFETITNAYFDLIHAHAAYFREMGLYTFRFEAGEAKLVGIFSGIPDLTACTLLPMLRGDFAKMLSDMQTGFPPDFRLNCRDDCTAVIPVEGNPGQTVEGLDKLPGDIGVFLHRMERANETLRFTALTGLFLCAREKSPALAYEKVKTARVMLTITP